MKASNVVPLFPEPEQLKPYAALTTSPHFERAWSAYPKEGRLRSSKKQAFAEWKKVAPQVGKEALAQAVENYAANDKDHKRPNGGGAPGFHRWLNWGRWEHWLPEAEAEAKHVIARRFPDEAVRASVVRELGEPWVVSWLDGCDWVEGLIVCKGATNLGKLNEVRSILKRLGVTVVLG